MFVQSGTCGSEKFWVRVYSQVSFMKPLLAWLPGICAVSYQTRSIRKSHTYGSLLAQQARLLTGRIDPRATFNTVGFQDNVLSCAFPALKVRPLLSPPPLSHCLPTGAVMSNRVTTSYMWLFEFQLNIRKNSVCQLHLSCFQCSTATSV